MTISPRITAIRWHPYRVPLRQPFATAHGVLAAREGAIVELVTSAGVTGYGDMAAVTEFGAPDITALLRAGYAAALEIRGSRFHDPEWLKLEFPLPAALIFALECAHMDAFSRSLVRESGPKHPRPSVRVNAVVSAMAAEEAAHRAQQRVAKGFRCIKLKVGMLASDQAEIERVRAVRTAIGLDPHLRLDANEAWSLAQAEAILSQLADLDIQFIEQPLAREDVAGMRTLRDRVTIPIAVDEALTDLASAQRIWEADAADVLIIKPQMIGGYAAFSQLLEQAEAHKKQVVITSSLESGVGVAATLAIVQDYQIFARPGTEGTLLECGLATLSLLEDPLVLEGLPIRDGQMHNPKTPSLRPSPNWKALARYRLEVPAL